MTGLQYGMLSLEQRDKIPGQVIIETMGLNSQDKFIHHGHSFSVTHKFVIIDEAEAF